MRPLFCRNKAHVGDEGILRFCQNRVRIEEIGDVVEAVVEEEVDAEDVVEADVDEAPTRACQTRGHVGDEGTHRCCQYRACGGRDHREPYASVGGAIRGGIDDDCGANQPGGVEGADVVRGCRSRRSRGRG